MTIIAAADGSALGNPGPAGWGWYVDPKCWAAGGWPHGTNNMGELTAILDLLQRSAHLDEELHVLSDSKYAIDTITRWMAGWKRRGWKKGDGKPVANLEIVKALDEAMEGRKVTFEWVKGHAGHALNEEADRLANGAAVAYKEGRLPEPGPGFGDAADPVLGAARAEDDLRMAAEEVLATSPGSSDLFSLFDDAEGASPDDDSALAPAPEADAETLVVGLERALLTDDVRSDPGEVAALLHPEWSEVGRTGRLLTRASFLEGVGPVGHVEMEVLEVSEVSPGVVLLVWRSHGRAGATLRSSWWVKVEGSDHGWVQRFHHASAEAR